MGATPCGFESRLRHPHEHWMSAIPILGPVFSPFLAPVGHVLGIGVVARLNGIRNWTELRYDSSGCEFFRVISHGTVEHLFHNRQCLHL